MEVGIIFFRTLRGRRHPARGVSLVGKPARLKGDDPDDAEENVDYGKTAYFKDPSGYHSFVIWEFQAKK